MFYTIYKTTNLVNGKFYVGKHKTKDLNDGYLGSGKLLKRSIAKYGIDNFHKEILHICESEEQMNTLERILVVPDPELNYNLCEGGKGGWSYLNKTGLNNAGKDWSIIGPKIGKKIGNHRREVIRNNPEERVKMALLAKKGWQAAYEKRGPAFKGKSHTDESKKKISVGGQKRTGDKNGSYGTCWITNGIENKKIQKKDIDSWIELGYNRGRS
jgi:hypothetical protein